MGTPKAALEWHGSTLVRRVVGILARSVGGPVVVVAAPGQELPALGSAVEVVVDARPERGPLEGLAAGLAAVAGRASVVYVSSTDVPLLHPSFVRAVVAALDAGVDAVVPESDGRVHPLAAAYRVSLLSVTQHLLAGDKLAMKALLDHCRVRYLAATELPAPTSLTNLNSRADYERAHALPAPPVTVDGSPARAWRLGDVAPSGRAGPTLNGEPIAPDPHLPLVAGDELNWNTV